MRNLHLIHIPIDADFVIPPSLDKVVDPTQIVHTFLPKTGRNRVPPETDKEESPMRHPPPCFSERPQAILCD